MGYPDPGIPVEQQVSDGVTGIYVSQKANGEWQPPRRVWLQSPGTQALDGAAFIQADTMWFASARTGYTGMHWFTAKYINGEWADWKEAGFDPGYEVGELHITADREELYFHSSRAGGKGGYDIWVCRNENGEWLPPQNVEAVNSPETDGWPFITQDGANSGSPGSIREHRPFSARIG